MRSTERWPAILLQLDSDGWTRAADLAQACEVSERTIYRDAHEMVEAGIPLQGVPGKGYRLPDEFLLSPIRLTTDEAVMLVLGSENAARQFEGRYRAAARAARSRIERVLPGDVKLEAQSLRRAGPLARPSIFGEPAHDGLLPQIREALADERTVTVRLSETDSSSTHRTIDPYGLVQHGTNWFLIGHEHERNRVVQLGLHNIDDLTLTSDTFDRPSGYGSPEAGGPIQSRQRIRLVFSEEVAPSVQVDPTFEVVTREQQSDGGLAVTIRVRDQSELIPWLLSWGRHVQVLEPQSLRERIAEETRATADQYDSIPTLLD